MSSTEEDRFYAYVRLETGDEMSKRVKFVLITWVGIGVRPLKKAKVSTDKTLIKELCPVREIVIENFCPYMYFANVCCNYDFIKQGPARRLV